MGTEYGVFTGLQTMEYSVSMVYSVDPTPYSLDLRHLVDQGHVDETLQ